MSPSTCLLILFFLAVPCDIRALKAATSDTARVRITIKDIDAFDVSDGGTITLTGQAGKNKLEGTNDKTAKLNYSHNSATPKKITAEVRPADNPPGHDITLKVRVAGGTGFQTLVLRGAPRGAVDVYTNITAGNLKNKTITYMANCTASGTQVSADTDFSFTVTFTTTD